jgi:nucleotide-binding universal stress UspA family protein
MSHMPDTPVFSTIVSGTDGERGRGAASLAQVIATATGAHLLLVGVEWDCPLPLADSYAQDRADLEAQLRGVRDDVAPQARTQVAFGLSAAHALRSVADAQDADLIVVGSHHRSGVQRMASIDVAMQVFHDAPCAVALAPDHLPPCRALHRIAVGIDDSAESAAALDMALDLARAGGAEVVLLAVASDVYTGSPALAMGMASLDSYRAILDGRVELMRTALDAALASCDGMHATGDVRLGDPANELIALSAHCDLLVLGSRRWGPVLRLALGSTTEAVMRGAHCPVLVPPRGVAAHEHAAHRAARENVLL